MREISCGRAARFLPLYAAGDLEGGREQEIASHVAACEGCRRTVAGLGASRALLVEACAAPEFGAEFYAGIRSSVLEQLSRDRGPSTPSLVAALFGRRLAYAATFAVALIAVALALQHFRVGDHVTPREIADAPQPISAPTKDQSQRVISAPLGAGADEAARWSSLAASRSRRGLSRRIGQASTRASVGNVIGHKAIEQSPSSVRNPLTLLAYEPGVVQRSQGGAGERIHVNGSRDRAFNVDIDGIDADSAEVSRIEIQTADPNIRIIWLAPQKSEAPDPNEPKNENGERK